MGISAVIQGFVLGLVLPQAEDSERGTHLARVPAGLEIASDLVQRGNRACYAQRSSISWSPDGSMVTFAALRGDKYVPVVGEKVGEAFGFVSSPTAAGGHAFFHVARRKDEDQERHWLWIDGKTIGPEDWMGDLAVRADGKQVCFWTNPGARFGNSSAAGNPKYQLVTATEKGSQWSLTRGDDWFASGAIRYPFGSRIACAAAVERGKGWTVLKAEKRQPALFEPCEGLESFDLSADGTGFAYVLTRSSRGSAGFLTKEDGAELIFRGRRVGKAHDVVSMATVDAAGAHVAYVASRQGKHGVAIDEEAAPHGDYDFVVELVFNPAGKRLAFAAVRGGREDPEIPGLVRGGEWFVAVRGIEGGADPIEQPTFHEVRDLRWDGSGEHLAYCARDDSGWHVISGETRSPPHEDIGPPVFSADGRSLGFGTRDADGLWWREIDLH